MGSSLRTRPAERRDHACLAKLWSETFPQLDETKVGSAAAPTDASVWVGFEADRVVAGAVITALVDQPTHRRLQVLAADDTHWENMHAFAIDELRRQRVSCWYVVVREDSHAVCRRLAEHGYSITSTSWGAHLDVTEPSLRNLRDLKDGLPDDLEIRELVPHDAGAAHTLFRRNRLDFHSTPATEAPNHTVEEFRALFREHRAFGVWQQDRLFAFTMMKQQSAGLAETDFTVTERGVRGRGLAPALKAHSVWCLAMEGTTRFGTGGAQANEASLKVNRRLGYQIEPLWLTYAIDESIMPTPTPSTR